MGLKVTNNAFGTLNAGITSSSTTIVLNSGEGARFPTLGAGDYFYATLIDTSNNLEIVKVTARSTDTMTVVRAQDNTTARAYSTNDRFELRPTAALFNEKANADDVTASLATKQAASPVLTSYVDTGVNFRNRIINGDMRIDQRNNGASVTLSSSGVFPVDRFQCDEDTDGVMTGQQSTTAPAGFVNSLVITTTTADTSLGATQYAAVIQKIEGTNLSDLGWGTANAKTVTLSFWVRSSLTGTFGGVVANSAHNRSYPFTYTISSADTWEQKTITISGDTSGTWLTTTGTGMRLFFGLGVGSTYSGTASAWAGSTYISATGATSVIGTLNATWYITGVQLEVGSVATPFERRPYGTELALCQRYYQKIFPQATNIHLASGYCSTTTSSRYVINLPVQMRIAPTALETSGTANQYAVNNTTSNFTCNVVPAFNSASQNTIGFSFNVASGLTANTGALARTDATNGAGAYLGWSAEL
jgi:hypothetical protein